MRKNKLNQYSGTPTKNNKVNEIYGSVENKIEEMPISDGETKTYGAFTYKRQGNQVNVYVGTKLVDRFAYADGISETTKRLQREWRLAAGIK